MRQINEIVVHCSATKAGRHVTVEAIRAGHTAPVSKGGRGWSDIGYHYVVYLDGTVHAGRPVERIGAHALRHNANSIGICYIGGLDANGKPADTRTPQQKQALRSLISKLCLQYNITSILGHRDTSPDLNHNGVIEPTEWLKACPCFDAITEYRELCRK